MTEAQLVRHEQAGTVWLTLNRPHAMNALTSEMFDQFDHQIGLIERDDNVRVVVVTATGRAFCAGADLGEIQGDDGDVDPARLLTFVRRAAQVMARLAALPVPVIGAINGTTLAGGLELAMHCDLIVAAESAHLGDGHVTYGLLPGAGGAARLPRLIGPRRAKYLAFTGGLLPAQDCLAIGLVNEVVADGELISRVTRLAAELSAKSRSALRLFKQAIDDGLDAPLPQALRLEALVMAEHLHSGDVDEGLHAFRDKRTPRFASGTTEEPA